MIGDTFTLEDKNKTVLRQLFIEMDTDASAVVSRQTKDAEPENE
jgi:hypothetical protein